MEGRITIQLRITVLQSSLLIWDVKNMAQWNRIRRALSVVLPAGAMGASVLLALASADVMAASNHSGVPQAASGETVSARLQAIRTGVSDFSGSASDGSADNAKAVPAWWGNGGWGRWRLGWGNGGGWHNGGWGNGGWHNWHNGGWGNGGGWNNGWHNFWHNW
jgi:rSAM-associated Gly-rich repeat protein